MKIPTHSTVSRRETVVREWKLTLRSPQKGQTRPVSDQNSAVAASDRRFGMREMVVQKWEHRCDG